MKLPDNNWSGRLFNIGAVATVILGLYLSSLHGYILFHSLVEILTVATGFTLFIVAWNARWVLKNNYLNILGIGYAFISFVDLLHTLAYKGMNVFPGFGANLPTQLWIAARYLQAVTLCAAPLLAERTVDRRVIFAGYAAAVPVLVAMVYSGNFPDCYIEGKGLTAFKIGSEYVIGALLLFSLYLLYRKRRYFSDRVFFLIVSSIACAIVSGIWFTAYLNVYDFANMAGHYFKLASFYLLYRALLVTGLREPFNHVFRELREAQEAIRTAHDNLEEQVRERTAELRASEEKYRALIESANDAVFVHEINEDGTPGPFFEVNELACRQLGYSRKELAGMSPMDLEEPNYRRRIREAMERLLKDGHAVFESAQMAKDGRSIPVEVSSRVIEIRGKRLSFSLVRDITQRKRREAQEQVRLRIFELLAQGGDLNEILCHVVKYVESAHPDFIGNIMLADAEGRYLRQTCSSGLPEDYLAVVRKVRIGDGIGSCGTAVWRGETVIAEDLSTYPFWAKYNSPALKAGLLSCWSEPIFGASGAVLGTISVYRRQPGSPDREDMELVRCACHLAAIAVERKRSLDALRESEARYRSLFEESIDGVFISSVEGKIIDISLTGVRMFGYDTREEMKRLDLKRDVYVNPQERDRLLSLVNEKGSGEYEAVLKKKNGETMRARCSMAVVRNTGGNVMGYQGVIRDITEERRLEQELFRAKRMEIIGQLAGGVAHEVRNPLNAILSISEALFRERDIADNPEYFPYVQHIRTQVGRLSKLMTDLLDLGKPIRPGSIQSVPLSEVLTDTINLWNLTEAATTHLIVFTSDDIVCGLMVNADSARLQQALLNLLENAAQHSPAGSEIRLHIGTSAGQMVTIQVRDSGKGITPEKLGKVFDPFFTTRPGGTGLGLPLVKHFVESMGGEVSIRNNEPPPGCLAELVLNIVTDERGSL